jgi:hypothetical protein
MYQLDAQDATILIHFIATAKITLVTKSIYAVCANISLYLVGRGLKTATLVVLFAADQASYTMTMNITQTSVVVTRAVIILSLLPSQP